MKTTVNKIVLVLTTLLLTACGIDYKIITKIFPDGSCERTMIARGDSSDVNSKLFVIDIDSSWSRDLKWDFDSSENKRIFILTVKKHFESVAEMNSEFHKSTRSADHPLTSQLLVKKFRWFYTRYEYNETYHQQFPFKYFPISDYLTPEEISIGIYGENDSAYFAGKDSVEIKRIKESFDSKTDTFFIDNIFEGFYRQLLTICDTAKNNLNSRYSLEEKKKELHGIFFKSCYNSTFFDENYNAGSVLNWFDSVFHTTDFSNILLKDSSAFNAFDDKVNSAFENLGGSDYVHYLSMPGKLMNTNASRFENNMPVWKVTSDSYYFSDYTMKATSRKTNTWAFVVTGIILLLSLISLLSRSRMQ